MVEVVTLGMAAYKSIQERRSHLVEMMIELVILFSIHFVSVIKTISVLWMVNNFYPKV